MPITFESIQDPLGIASAGTLLGQMLFQKKQQERELANKMAIQQMKDQTKMQQTAQLMALLGLGAPEVGQTNTATSVQPSAIATMPLPQTTLQMIARSPLPGFSLNPLENQDMGFAVPQLPDTRQTALSDALAEPMLESRTGAQQQNISLPTSQDGQDFIANMDPRKIAAVAAVSPQMANTVASLYQASTANKLAREKFEFDKRKQLLDQEREYNKKGIDEERTKVEGIRSSIRGKEAALQASREAVLSGDVGALSMNNLAEIFHRPELLTASGAALTLAGKESILSNMAKVSAKGQNQWFEQRLAQMFPMIGRSKYANMTFQVLLESELARDRAYVQAWDKIASEDEKKYGTIRVNTIGARIEKALESIDKRIMREASYKTRQLLEQEKGDKWVMQHANEKVPSGTMLTYPMRKALTNRFKGDWEAALRYAKGLGYVIPTREEVEQWQ